MKSKIDLAIDELKILIRARYPIIYIQSDEKEMDVMKEILKICLLGTKGSEGRSKFRKKLIHWDVVNGFSTPVVDGQEIEWRLENQDARDPMSALDYIREGAKETDQIFILSEFHHFLEDVNIQRRLRIFAQSTAITQRKMIIILSPKNDGISGSGKQIPTELENVIHLFSWPYPDSIHIRRVLVNGFIPNLNDGLESAGYPAMKFEEEKLKEIIDSCKGMTVAQIDNATSKSIVKHQTLVPSIIAKEKKQIIQKSGLCEYVEPNQSLEDIGGNDRLKDWLRKRKEVLTDEAYSFGCDLPRGVLFLGPWGSGKSSAAKAVINEWGMPGIRVDASKIYSMYVGDSEKRIRSILDLADSVSPCIIGSSKILLSDGSEETIENIFNKSKKIKEKDGFEIRKVIDGIEISSFCDDFEIKKVKPKYVTRKKVFNLISIKNRYSEITCTEDHLVATLDTHGDILWKKAKDITLNDFLITTNKAFEVKKDIILSTQYICNEAIIGDKTEEYFLRSSINEKCYVNHRSIRIPKNINKDIMYLLGLIKSDGYIVKRGSGVGFVNSDKILIDVFKEKIREIFGNNIKFTETETKPENLSEKSKIFLGINERSKLKVCYSVRINSVIMNHFFTSIYNNIMKFDEDMLLAYLSGYMDGDGSVRKNELEPLIVFCNKGEDVEKNEIQNILLKMCVFSGKTSKGVEISSRTNVIRLCEKLERLNMIKKKNKKEGISRILLSKFSIINDRNDVVYVPELLKDIKKNIHENDTKISKKIGGNYYEYCNGKRSIPRFRLKLLYDNYKKYIDKNRRKVIEKILIKSNIFSRVKEVKNTFKDEYVFDLINRNDKKISERNFIANNAVIHNCILWWDEIENLLSGDDGPNDGGASSRVVGIISTWMSEHSGMVFSIFTANDISNRPPKLFRKGRLDEIFIVDLPVFEERKEILKIHARKRLERQGKENILESIDYDLLAKISRNFSGAELESAINSAFIDSFSNKRSSITTGGIEISIKETIPLALTMKENITRMRDWQKGRAVRASKYEPEEIVDSSNYRYNEDSKKVLDIAESE